MSRFPVCEPPPCIQSPSFSRPTIEAGVTNTQRSWRVSLTPTHYQTPPATLFAPNQSPLSQTQIWSIPIVFCSGCSCSSCGQTSSAGRNGDICIYIYIYIYIYTDRRRGRQAEWETKTESNVPFVRTTRETQTCRYIDFEESNYIQVYLITIPLSDHPRGLVVRVSDY